jgi:DNA-binding GntR family transcriptional regulator
MEKAIGHGDIEKWNKYDKNFHNAMYDTCENTYLTENIRRLYDQIHLRRQILTHELEHIKRSTIEHRAVLEAIKRQDAEGARSISNQHWERLRMFSLKHII